MLKAYLKYLRKAKGAFQLHSPFVFNFYNDVIKNKEEYYAFVEIRDLKKQLLENRTTLTISDFGAGSKKNKSNTRTVREIAKNSVSIEKKGELLFKIANYLKANTIVELGTSLGISTAYLSKARTSAQIYSFEGCENILNVAKENFSRLDINNVKTIQGNINDNLKKSLETFNNVDLFFLDANHTYEATITYFSQCSNKCLDNSCIIIDDIHWSKGMEKAWEEIKKMSTVSTTIDLFWVGIVFFKKNIAKENFILRF